MTVGRLVLVMDDAKAHRLWAADGMEVMNPSAADREAAIKAVVSRMFATYPTRLKK